MELQRTEYNYYAPQCIPVTIFHESADAIVPDTFPDMGQIVCAQGMVTLKDILVQNDRMLLSGVVNVQVLYRPETGMVLRKLSLPISFAHIAEHKGLTPEVACQVVCKLASLEAKPVNSRKVSVTAQVAVENTAFLPQKLKLTQMVQQPPTSLQQRTTCPEKRFITHITTDDFTILEDIPVTGGSYLEVLHTDVQINCTEKQAVGDHIVLKGDIMLDITCLDDDSHLQTMAHKLRFSQVIEGAAEMPNAEMEVSLAIHHVDCMMRGEGMLAVGLGVRAMVLVCTQTALPLLEDCYDVDYLCTCKTVTAQVHALQIVQPYSTEVNFSLPLQREVGEVIGMQAVCTGMRKVEEGWSMTLQVHGVFTDGQGAVWSTNRTVTCPLPQAAEQPRGVALQLLSTQGTQGEMTVRMQCSMEIYGCATESLTDITAVDQGQPRTQANITLLLAYVQTKESLWDIAKKHASTILQIRMANGLETTTETVEDCMLLIPICAG